MANLTIKSFDKPDETRKPDKTVVAVVDLGSSKAARLTTSSRAVRSQCIKPVVGGESCQVRHVGVITAGRMHVKHNDGTEGDAGPGDAYVIEPGHDAWVIGDEPVVAFEFESNAAATFARSD